MQLNQPNNFAKLFLDMNCFFASVEQQVQPPFRDKPIAVAPYTGPTGCLISPSKKAKEWGVKTGMSVAEGKKVCPKLQVLPSRPFLYHLYHKEIVKVLESFTPYFQILSIDEMVLNLDPSEQNEKTATGIALLIKEKIKQQVGDFLTCSIGVSANQFLAKVAAESKKPDGLTIITLDQLEHFYQQLTLLDLPGINFRMRQALNFIGINNPLDFWQTRLEVLDYFFKYPGKLWYWRLRGFEVDQFVSQTSSIGHSFILPPIYRSPNGAKKTVIKLVTKVGVRLRQEKYLAGALSLTIRFFNHRSQREFISFTPVNDSQTLIAQVFRLLEKISFRETPLGIFVVAFKLRKTHKTYSLFPEIQKMSDLSQAVDKINDRFGPETIYYADTDGDTEIAPNRIAFGKPRFKFEEK